MEPKRILILTADAGFGHRSAANAIAAALQLAGNGELVVEVANPMDDRRVPTFIRKSQSDYDKIVQKAPELYRFGFQASDAAVPSSLMEGALSLILLEAVRDLIRRFQPDTIVSTYPLYLAPLSLVFSLSKTRIPLLTVVTDLGLVHRLWFNDVTDLCMVPAPLGLQQAMDAGLPSERVRITGIPVHPELAREPGARNLLRQELGWQPERTTVLAVGSRRVKQLREVLRGVNHSGLSIQLVLVAGGDDDLYRRLLNNEWHLPVTIYNYVENMPAMLRASDCVISKAGGLIVTETMAVGLPMILIDVLPGQETGNAEFVLAGEAGEMGKSALEVLEILCHWLENDGALLSRFAENARLLGRPWAAFDVAELAMEYALRGPTITPRKVLIDRQKISTLLEKTKLLAKDRRPAAAEE
jgi:1,2-diacylglycerol 3-beta-galactosyltransferase